MKLSEIMYIEYSQFIQSMLFHALQEENIIENIMNTEHNGKFAVFTIVNKVTVYVWKFSRIRFYFFPEKRDWDKLLFDTLVIVASLE